MRSARIQNTDGIADPITPDGVFIPEATPVPTDKRMAAGSVPLADAAPLPNAIQIIDAIPDNIPEAKATLVRENSSRESRSINSLDNKQGPEISDSDSQQESTRSSERDIKRAERIRAYRERSPRPLRDQ